MNKQEFLARLEKALADRPPEELAERLTFYREMIDDRMEDGLSEEEAVAAIGSVDTVAAQIAAELPPTGLDRETAKPKRVWKAWEIILLVLGAPVWLPLLIAAAAVLFSVYLVLWAVVLSLWTLEISLWACVLGGIAATMVYFIKGSSLPALMMLGTAFLISGLSIFMFFGCVEASKGIFKMTKRVGVAVKSMCIRKGNAQ